MQLRWASLARDRSIFNRCRRSFDLRSDLCTSGIWLRRRLPSQTACNIPIPLNRSTFSAERGSYTIWSIFAHTFLAAAAVFTAVNQRRRPRSLSRLASSTRNAKRAGSSVGRGGGRPETVHFAARREDTYGTRRTKKTCQASETLFAAESLKSPAPPPPAADAIVMIVYPLVAVSSSADSPPKELHPTTPTPALIFALGKRSNRRRRRRGSSSLL